MPRGGKRRGTQGKPYPNRTDLRGPGTPDIPKKSFTGQPYGAATQQAQVQATAPAGPPAAPPGGAPAMPQAAGAGGPPPGGLGAFNRPSERPGEPLTHGLPMGAGAGPEVLSTGSQNDPITLQLRALYSQYPISEIAELLEEL
jgi:hypothetical protein